MKKHLLGALILFFVTSLFFYPVLKGRIPFPGDLLITQYSPWRFYSYLGYNPGSYPTKLQYFDILNQLYPWKILVIEQLKSGQMPLWNPYNFAGSPLLANLQSQAFSPFNVVYFFLPHVYGWSFGLIMQVILAFFFTYFYSRQIKLGREGSVLAATAFSCSLYMSVFFQYGVFGQTILWVPLIFLCIEKLLLRFSLKSTLLLVAAVTFAIFGGHLQIFFYVSLFSLSYLLVRILSLKRDRVKKIMELTFLFLIALGIASIQLIPSFELIGLSARVPHDKAFFLDKLLLKINELIVFISPDFYGNPASHNYLLDRSYPQTAFYIGIIPLIFALSAVFLKKSKLVKFYISVFFIALLAVTKNPVSVLFYSLQVPFISSSSPTNGIFIISFSLSILAGYGLDQWVLRKNKFILLSSLLLFVLLILVCILYKVINIEFNTKNVLYSISMMVVFFIIFLISRFSQQKKLLATLLIVLTVFDLFYFFQKFNPFVPASLIFPHAKVLNVIQEKAGINRVWGYGSANISANTNSIYHFSSPDGNDPLYPKVYGEFIYASGHGKLLEKFSKDTRSNGAIDSSFGFVPNNEYALRILNILGVHYILDRDENGSTQKTFPIDDFSLIYHLDGWKLYKNKRAAERVFLTSNYQVYGSNAEFEKKFFSKEFNISKAILLQNELDFPSKENNPKGDQVSIVSYKANDIVVRVKVNSKKLLFLSDMYFPGWKAYVDGKDTPIIRTDYAFRSVVIPYGNHQVEFHYRPTSFVYGLIVMFTSLMILFIVSVVAYMRKW